MSGAGPGTHRGALRNAPAKHKPPGPDTIDAFVRIVGASHAIRDEAEMAPYLVEWRDRYRGKAALVLKPGDASEVSSILKLANETMTAIVPQGGNTGLVGGDSVRKRTRSGHFARTAHPCARHRPCLEHDDGRSRAHARASASGRRERGPTVSLEPRLGEGSAQIGGVLATNAGGTAVLAYGSARELALGLEVVLAGGEVWNGLKSLRKDNSGYDLKDLIVGSEGTLGIITAAVLRLFPKVAEKVTCMAGLDALETALAFFARALERVGAALTAFEILPRIGVELVLRHGQGTRDPFPSPHQWYAPFELTSPREEASLAPLAEFSVGQRH